MTNRDPFDMAEGTDALDTIIEQGPPKGTRKNQRNPKAAWEQTNIRIHPRVKRRLRTEADRLGVPLEDVIHFGLEDFLERLDSGETELPEPRPATTRMTLLRTS